MFEALRFSMDLFLIGKCKKLISTPLTLASTPSIYIVSLLGISIEQAPYGRTSRVWESLLVRKSGCAGGRGFAPGRGDSKVRFSSNQDTNW